MDVISVIVAVFNEEGNIRELHSRLKAVFQAAHFGHYELLFVDDGSTDRSAEIVKELAMSDSHVRGLVLSKNFGQQIALTAGMDHVKGDAVIMMDADLQHPPELIPKFIEQWQAGYDIVYSVREDSPHQPWVKKATSRIFYALFNKFSKLDLPFGTADFRLISRRALDSLRTCTERTRFLRGLIDWIGYRKMAINYIPDKRFSGTTKYTFKKMVRLAVDGTLSFSSVPLTFSMWIGIAAAAISMIYGFYALWAKIFLNTVLPGWTSTQVSVLFLGSVQLICIGIIGSYLSRIYEEVKQRPLYLIKERLGKQ